MKLKFVVMAACLATCAACSDGGAGGASRGEPATAADCRAMVQKGMDLQGIPVAAMGELFDQSVQSCANSGKVTKEDYRCVMAATSTTGSRACKVDF